MYVLVGEQIFRIVPGIRRKRQVEKGFSQNFAKVADSSVRKNLAKNEEKSGSTHFRVISNFRYPICHYLRELFVYKSGFTDFFLDFFKN